MPLGRPCPILNAACRNPATSKESEDTANYRRCRDYNERPASRLLCTLLHVV